MAEVSFTILPWMWVPIVQLVLLAFGLGYALFDSYGERLSIVLGGWLVVAAIIVGPTIAAGMLAGAHHG